MKTYEKFKTEANRLTSITCDGCSKELYKGTPHRGHWSNLKLALVQEPKSEWFDWDFCEDCARRMKGVIKIVLIGLQDAASHRTQDTT